jgi:hypothetical protein
VPQVDTVFHHGWLIRKFQPDMPMVLLQLCVDRRVCMPNLNVTTLTRDCVYSRRLQSQVVVDRPKETKDFPLCEANRLHTSIGASFYISI